MFSLSPLNRPPLSCPLSHSDNYMLTSLPLYQSYVLFEQLYALFITFSLFLGLVRDIQHVFQSFSKI